MKGHGSIPAPSRARLRSPSATTCAALLLGAAIPTTDAQVVLDGTLGQAGPLPGPDVTIPSTVGRSVGGNLFHSFSELSIAQGESATFTGPASVNNIIGRVSGGNPSVINGVLRSDIANSNLYLLNPAGLLFGSGAVLQVEGSFHASTANYLRLEDELRFTASPSSSDAALSASAPSAFGFDGDSRGRITFDRSEIAVREGRSLSVIGGVVEVASAPRDPSALGPVEGATRLAAPDGRINIVSVASEGEVVITATGIDLSAVRGLGDVAIERGAFVDAGGRGGGDIHIRGDDVRVRGGRVAAKTVGNRDGGVVDIEASRLLVEDGAIDVSTSGSGSGGDVRINASEFIRLSGRNSPANVAGVFVTAEASGNAGTAHIETGRLWVLDGAVVSGRTSASGNGGNIEIHAADTLVSGETRAPIDIGDRNRVVSSSVLVDSIDDAETSGDGGKLTIEGRVLRIADGARISGRTRGGGDGGSQDVTLTGRLEISGAGPVTGVPSRMTSAVGFDSNSGFDQTGDAGPISISVGELLLRDGGLLASSTFTAGNAAPISVEARSVVLSGGGRSVPSSIDASTRGRGAGAIIDISADELRLENGARINSVTLRSGPGGDVRLTVPSIVLSGQDADGRRSSINNFSAGAAPGSGAAGDIVLGSGQRVVIEDGAAIRAGTRGPGAGGTIRLTSSVLEVRGGGLISTVSEPREAAIGAGDAGAIEIEADSIRLDESAIEASTTSADGGNVSLIDFRLVHMLTSSISTAVGSGEGDGGNINVMGAVDERATYVLLDQSSIAANAFGGNGGNILIAADGVVRTPDSVIDASSRTGIDGEEIINAPEIDISSRLKPLAASLADVSEVLATPCAARSGADVIHLRVAKVGLVTDSPHALATHAPDIDSVCGNHRRDSIAPDLP